MQGPLSVELWYRAFGSPLGVIIATGDPERTKMKLYSLRKEANDPDLYLLSILTSPTNPKGELWIVRKAPNAPQS